MRIAEILALMFAWYRCPDGDTRQQALFQRCVGIETEMVTRDAWHFGAGSGIEVATTPVRTDPYPCRVGDPRPLADDRADLRPGNGDDRDEAEGDHEQAPFCIAAIHRPAAGNQGPSRGRYRAAAAPIRRPRIGRSRPWSRSGNENLACDVSVALPEGHFAGQERIVRRRLHVAVDVKCP